MRVRLMSDRGRSPSVLAMRAGRRRRSRILQRTNLLRRALNAKTPFPGLQPYLEEDAIYFFGRERETRIVVANLIASRLTILHGESGVGKTSLLHAGVVKSFRDRQLSGRPKKPTFIIVVYSSWEREPVQTLTQKVQKTVEPYLFAQGVSIREHSRLLEFLSEWTDKTRSKDVILLVILDQFEQYFLYERIERLPQARENRESAFSAEFAKAVAHPDFSINFLISVREEALGKLDVFKGSIPNLFDNRLEIRHLDRGNARAAIENSIKEFNSQYRLEGRNAFQIEPALVDAVLNDVQAEKILLGEETGRGGVEHTDTTSERFGDKQRVQAPYLQLVMRRLWNEECKRHSRLLRLATLVELGGAEGIVQAHLDSVVAELSVQQQRIAASVFSYLVTPSGGKISYNAWDLTNLANLAEMPDVEKVERVSDEVDRVLARLQERRILRPLGEAPDGHGCMRCKYEISHDVLASVIMPWRTRYFQVQKAKSNLPSQVLAQLRRGESESAALLARQAYRFSRGEGRDVISEVDSALRATLGTAPFTYILHRNKFYDFPSIAFDPDGHALSAGSKQGFVYLWEHAHSDEPPIAFPAHPSGCEVTAVAFSPDGTTLASAGRDGTIKLSNVERLKERCQTAVDPSILFRQVDPVILRTGAAASSIAYHPDGKVLVSGNWDGLLQMWDIQEGKVIQEWQGHDGWIWSVAFGPDGKILGSGGRDAIVRIWDLDRPGTVLALLEGHEDEVFSLAFDPNCKWLASGSRDKAVRLWRGPEWASGQTARLPLGYHQDNVRSVAFSPDGGLLASAGDDETVRLWEFSDSSGPHPVPRLLQGHFYGISSVAFSPKRYRVLASSSWDRTIRIWEVETVEPKVLSGHQRNVMAVAFSPDGKNVASGSWDRTMRLWDISQPGVVECRTREHGGEVFAVAFFSSSDGQIQTLASGSLDGCVRLWDLRQFDRNRPPLQHGGPVSSVAFNPNGQILASGGHDGKVRLWDLCRPDTPLCSWDHPQSVTSVAFSPDGKLLASGCDDSTVRLWTVEPLAGASPVAELTGHVSRVWTVAFSPDGKLLASGSDDSTVRLWTMEQPAKPTLFGNPLKGHEFWVGSVAFHPEAGIKGGLLASGSYDLTIRLWDLKDLGNPVVLRGHQQSVTSVAFSSDGKRIVSGSYDNTVRVWTVDTEALADMVCEKVSRNLSWEEWQQFIGAGIKYERTCCNFPGADDLPSSA